MKILSRSIPVVVLLAGLAMWPAVGADVEEQVGFRFHVQRTNVWKGVFGATDVNASGGGAALKVGESEVGYFGVGAYNDQGLAIDSSRMTISDDKQWSEAHLIATYPHVWRVERRLQSYDGKHAIIELSWKHLYSEKRGSVDQVGGDTRRIRLSLADRHVFDFHAQNIDADQYDANMVFEIRMRSASGRQIVTRRANKSLK